MNTALSLESIASKVTPIYRLCKFPIGLYNRYSVTSWESQPTGTDSDDNVQSYVYQGARNCFSKQACQSIYVQHKHNSFAGREYKVFLCPSNHQSYRKPGSARGYMICIDCLFLSLYLHLLYDMSHCVCDWVWVRQSRARRSLYWWKYIYRKYMSGHHG